MNLEEEKELYRAAVEKFGFRSQMEMLQEEATELALATRKAIRAGIVPLDNLAEEAADVLIMLEQLKVMMPSMIIAIEQQKQLKLKRLKAVLLALDV
jgi:NTP pyrophosphatase (non-canonical NTP hydrolase)